MSIHPVIKTLLAEIEAFRAATGMTEASFGRKALNDPKFIRDVREGDRSPSIRTVGRVHDFMREYEGERT